MEAIFLEEAIGVSSIFETEPTFWIGGVGVYYTDAEVLAMAAGASAPDDGSCSNAFRKTDGRPSGDAANCAARASARAARLTDRAYKPICPFGYLSTWLCAVCVKTSPFDGRRLFCPIGSMW